MKRTYWFEWLIIYSVIGLYIFETFYPLGDKIEYWIGSAGRSLSCILILVIFFKCIYEVVKGSGILNLLDKENFTNDHDSNKLIDNSDETKDND